jgi:hypothetical protein
MGYGGAAQVWPVAVLGRRMAGVGGALGMATPGCACSAGCGEKNVHFSVHTCRAVLGSAVVGDEDDLPDFAGDLVKVVSGKAELQFSR